MTLLRRGIITGIGALLAAPSIIRTPGILMPVNPDVIAIVVSEEVPGEIRFIGLPQLKFEGGKPFSTHTTQNGMKTTRLPLMEKPETVIDGQ